MTCSGCESCEVLCVCGLVRKPSHLVLRRWPRFLPDPNNPGECIFKDGALWRCMTMGGTFIADELNLAPPEVLATIAHVLDFPSHVVNPVSKAAPAPLSPQFGFIATQNPPSYTGRRVLPAAISQRLLRVPVPAYTSPEVAMITEHTFASLAKRGQRHSPDPRLALAVTAALRYDPTGKDHTTGLRHFIKLYVVLCLHRCRVAVLVTAAALLLGAAPRDVPICRDGRPSAAKGETRPQPVWALPS